LIIDARQRDIARIALAAAGRKYGVAFAGGGALQLHDVSERRTQDVDLFVRKPRDVVRAAAVIAEALRRAGYRVEPVADDAGPGDAGARDAGPGDAGPGDAGAGNTEAVVAGWPSLEEELREFEVYPPGGGEPVQVQVAHFAFTNTVATDVGPAVTLEYLAARKMVALLERHRVRDYVDIASLKDTGYELRQLVGLAFAEDPSLTAEDVGDAGVHLDRAIADERLARELPPGKTPDWVRAAFTDWPREPVHSDEPLR
jgi:hypothetical protein